MRVSVVSEEEPAYQQGLIGSLSVISHPKFLPHGENLPWVHLGGVYRLPSLDPYSWAVAVVYR